MFDCRLTSAQRNQKILKVISFNILNHCIFLLILSQAKKKSHIDISFKLNTPLNGQKLNLLQKIMFS